jgi:septal ring factor EnvC (AmiA/AmiB activator)
MRMPWRIPMGLAVMVACLHASAAKVSAQDGANLDQVKKMYQDALVQLKEAQDRKSELANENAKLTSHIADLEKQIDTFKHEAAGEAEKTFFLRSRFAAWEEFMKQYPDLTERWKAWLKGGAVKTGTLPAMGDDADWPFEE